MASNEPRARNFDLVPDPRITIPARGMSWPHLRGLKHDRTRSRAQKVRENPCIEGGIQTWTPIGGHDWMPIDSYKPPVNAMTIISGIDAGRIPDITLSYTFHLCASAGCS